MSLNPFETSLKSFHDAAELAHINSEVVRLLEKPQRQFEFTIPVRMDDGHLEIFTAYRIHHNDALGQVKNGVRVVERFGLEVIVPNDTHKDEINDIIFNELCIGEFKNVTRERFKSIIGSYEVDGVILGCTELPLLLHQEDTEIPVINSMGAHCEDILEFALAE